MAKVRKRGKTWQIDYFDRTGKQFFIEGIREYFGEDTLLENIRYLNLETHCNHLRQKISRRGTILTDASINRIISCLRHIFK